MKVEVGIRHNFNTNYQFYLTVGDFNFFYNSSISDKLDVQYNDFKKRLLKVIDKRKIVRSINEFIFIVEDFSELDLLVNSFKEEFVKELTTLNLEG